MLRRATFALYIAVIVVMAAATVIENFTSTEYAHVHIYGAWWFTLLWAMLTAAAVVYIIRRCVRHASAHSAWAENEGGRRWLIVSLHASFVVILAGALLTHLTAKRGIIHLRIGERTNVYTAAGGRQEAETRTLPFTLRLDTFRVVYHEGTTTAADYVSTFTVTDGNVKREGRVSMNNIFTYSNMRLYQASYDSDCRGSVLSMNYDPYGIPVTYTGYALLFASLVWMLIDPRGKFRRLLRGREPSRRGVLTVAMLLLTMTGEGAKAATVMPKEQAAAFGQLLMVYNGRICPVETYAMDFTKKLYGKATYKNYTAEQVLTGFMFWPDEWADEPIVRVKGAALRERLQLADHVSVNALFDRNSGGGYILGPYIREYFAGNRDKLHSEAADVDNRIELVMGLRQGIALRLFPYTTHTTAWFAAADSLPAGMEEGRQLYIKNILRLLDGCLRKGDTAVSGEIITKMQRYQETFGGRSLPSPARVKAEHAYNAVPFATILFMINLTAGIIAMLYAIYKLTRTDERRRRIDSVVTVIQAVVLTLSFLSLTVCLALRWIISGTVPMSNGYETMLLTAWIVMLIALAVGRRLNIALAFGLLLSGFFLLVSHISQMDPQITHLMPVLSSPLLTVHVSVVMMAFAMLSMTFLCAVTAITLFVVMQKRQTAGGNVLTARLEALQRMSQLFLLPALTLLGMGIFIGAIWANVSWGTYWSWDPKETWALIMFMVYAVAVHDNDIPALRKPLCYHLFMALAFLTIIMTYFGVNYVLGGMHSYA